MLVRLVRYSFGSMVARLGPLSCADDRSAQCELCNIVLFRPTFSAFGFPYVKLNTCSLSQLCCFYRLFIAVDMQCRETYTWHSLLETGWEYATHLHLKRYTSKQLVFRHTSKITFYNKDLLGTPKTNITSCKKGHKVSLN